ncbi:rabenosyn-5 [Anabrus simplex]|uniref:rabenosyn-5 n=1 Tax=Anabrus simplex TaxID=316456 RepID=UPI0035A3087A
MADGGEILEGFLCPVCKADLGSEQQLRSHFQDEHKEYQDVLKSLKDVFEKAKRFLKSDDDSFSTFPRSSTSNEFTPGNQTIEFEPQEFGVTRSHLIFFRRVRDKRLERYTAETNKLLIRLGKLLTDLPLDPVKRKQHEQSIVPWIDDRDVKLCPTCAKSFHVARRKHHCRLCGAIMCHDCTHFLELTSAKKMLSSGLSSEETASSPGQSPPTVSLAGYSGSNTSLNSVLSLVDTVAGDQNLRLCVHCKELLDTREKLKESRNLKPIISQFYDRLLSYITEADQLSGLYLKMCQSLNCGESAYDLSEAHNVRAKLLKLAENIDSLSKKIVVLGTKDVENPPRGKTLQLQQMIRLSTACYLKEQLTGLPGLPSEAQFRSMQDRRR